MGHEQSGRDDDIRSELAFRKQAMKRSHPETSDHHSTEHSLPFATQEHAYLVPMPDSENAKPPSSTSTTRRKPVPHSISTTSIHQAVEAENKSEESSHSNKPEPLLKSWWWEIITWLFATCSVSTIFVLLSYFDGKPTGSWNSVISINTIVVILAQATQSTLLVPLSACISQLQWSRYQRGRPLIELSDFDRASRGPGGSMSLLWKHGILSLVSLGAFTTVTLLTFSPFSQQAVRATTVDWVESESKPQMPRVTDFDLTHLQLYTNYGFGDSIVGAGDVGLPMRGAVSNGLYEQSLSPSDVSGFCPTSNCTWAPYSSVAFCSSVEDVTPTLQKECSPGLYSTICNYTVAALQDVPSTALKPYGGFGSTDVQYNNLWIISPAYGVTAQDLNTINVVEIYVIYQRDLTMDVTLIMGDACKNCVIAVRGTISLCRQTFQSDAINNTTKTKQIAASYDWDKDMINFEPSLFYDDVDGTKYTSNNQTMRAMRSFLSNEILVGSASILEPAGGDTYFASNAARVLATDLYGPNFTVTDADQQRRNIGKRLEQIAISMTNSIRRESGNATAIQGQSWLLDQYLHVEFYWLIMPAFLYFLTTIFFAATVVTSRRSGAPLWKSSPLVLLQDRKMIGDSGTLRDIEAHAKTVKAQLRPNGKTWSFVPAVNRPLSNLRI